MVRLAHRTFRLAAAGALLSLASAAILPRAAAAQYPLDSTIAQQMQITGDAEGEVRRWASDNIEAITSDDPERIRRGKSALARPLRDAATTVAFRVKASELLVPQLRAAIEEAEDAEVVGNMAIIAADLASEGGLEVLRQLRADDRRAVRYLAIKGLGTAMLLAEQSEPAFQVEAAQRLVDELGRNFAAESDPAMLVAYVTSLEHASSGSRFPGLRDQALQALATAVATRLDNLNGEVADVAELDPLVRGLIHTRGQMIRVRNPVGRDAQQAGVQAAGQMVAWGFRFARRQERLPDPENPAEVDLHRLLHTGVNLAVQTLTLVAPDRRQAIEELNLMGALTQGDLQGFVNGALRLLGDDGILAQPPFSVPAGTFRLQ